MADWNLEAAAGAPGTSILWRGTFSSSIAYNPGDVVSLTGSPAPAIDCYICKAPSQGYSPSGNPTYWDVMCKGAAGPTGAQGTPGTPKLPRGYISGLNTNLWSSTQYAQVAAGECRDSTNTTDMALTSQTTKDSSVAWAPGNYQGGIDVVAALTNTTYHIFLIRNPTTSTVEVLISLSPTAPTLPSGYTTFRRIASYMRAGGTGVKYYQDGNYFWRDSPERDLDGISVPLTAAGTFFTLTRVPSGIRGIVIYDALNNTSAAAGAIWASSPYVAGTGVSPFGPYVNLVNQYESTHAQVEFNATPSIRIHTAIASGVVNFWMTVFGWIDFRGQNDPLIS